jgi:hypothetical protein
VIESVEGRALLAHLGFITPNTIQANAYLSDASSPTGTQALGGFPFRMTLASVHSPQSLMPWGASSSLNYGSTGDFAMSRSIEIFDYIFTAPSEPASIGTETLSTANPPMTAVTASIAPDGGDTGTPVTVTLTATFDGNVSGSDRGENSYILAYTPPGQSGNIVDLLSGDDKSSTQQHPVELSRTATFQAKVGDSFGLTMDLGTFSGEPYTGDLAVKIAIQTGPVPTAANHRYSATNGRTLTIPASSGVLQGATDPNGLPLHAVLDSPPLFGALTLNADGSFTYSPNITAGGDVFSYHLTDGLQNSRSAQVSVDIASAPASSASNDLDGDGKTDLAVFRPSNGQWFADRSSHGFLGTAFGTAGDVPVAADYDGDGKTDLAVFRPSNGQWFIAASASGYEQFAFGARGDIPVPGNYHGVGHAELAVYRLSITHISSRRGA